MTKLETLTCSSDKNKKNNFKNFYAKPGGICNPGNDTGICDLCGKHDRQHIFLPKIEKEFRFYQPRQMSLSTMGRESTPHHVELMIVGEDSLPVPAATQYTAVLFADGVEIEDFWHVWSLTGPADGVSIDTMTGILVVGETATAEAITICLDIAGFSTTKTITLIHPIVEEEVEEEEVPGEEAGTEETEETSDSETDEETEDIVPVPGHPGYTPVEGGEGNEDTTDPVSDEDDQSDVPDHEAGADDNTQSDEDNSDSDPDQGGHEDY